ncbi:hypothetical protein [Paracoccus sp. S1E-3]|uniref:hypothetical protein n=1 Tax=Paracoccus sp. S1E-3 TaxID=2756130 RepID=UPI0015EF66DF|nr:hypothetical protein [Paracoccus sp. S1E-3]MBA4490215.1 hypothetical protein [Paracoccus sp. S1E-3]
MSFMLKTAIAAGAMMVMAGCTLDDVPMDERPSDKQTSVQSPVAAFTGGGKDWTIKIQSTGKASHAVQMTIPGNSQQWVGTLDYKGQPADAPSDLTVLSGRVMATPAMLPATVEIKPGNCSTGGQTGTSSVSVYLEGEKPLRGCGSMAMR